VGVELEDFEARRVDESAHVPVPPTTPLFSVLRGLEKQNKKELDKEYENEIELIHNFVIYGSEI
jgi:hypothetical protein